MNINKKVSDYIAKAPEAQIQIPETQCNLIHQSIPNISEEVK
jgi:hypothetical protein